MATQRDQATQAHNECARIARPVGSPFRYASLKLPEATQQLTAAIKALDAELGKISIEISEPQVAFARLDWWRAALQELTQGQKPEHPILLALADAAARQQRLSWLGNTAFIQAIESRLGAVQIELEYHGFEREADLTAFLAARGGSVYQLYAQCLALSEDRQQQLVSLGAAQHRLYLLRYLGRTLPTGRNYLPESLLKRFDVPQAQAHQLTAIPAELIATELNQIQTDINQSQQAYPGRMPAFFRILTATDRAYIKTMQKDPASVLEQRLELTPFQHWWVAWQASF